MMLRAGLLLFCFSSVGASCADSGGATLQGGGRRNVDSSGGTVALGLSSAGSYRPIALASSGSIAGKITLQSARDTLPPDSASAVDTVSATAKGRLNCVDVAETPDGGNTLVWVEGVEAGKPLPDVRRSTLSIAECRFQPRLMAVATGTTINLFSGDHATYTTRFYREGATEPVAVAHTVDAGQVVPSEKIASHPGFVEARRAEQQWARAYVAVFDHPYFAVADASGNFTIDSLPPGTYTVKVWHEGMEKPTEQRVTVTPGGTGRLDLTLTLP